MITFIFDLLIYIGILIAFFSGFFFYKIYLFFDTIHKLKKNYIKVFRFLDNGQIKQEWKKIEGNTIVYKKNDMEMKVELKFDKDYVFFDGPVPCIFLDKNLRQLKVEDVFRSEGISLKEFENMLLYSYEAGKLFKSIFAKDTFTIALIVLLIIILLINIFVAYKIYNLQIPIQTITNVTNQTIPI